jgi:hypothetical protein
VPHSRAARSSLRLSQRLGVRLPDLFAFAIVLLGTSQVRSPGGDPSYYSYYYRCSAAVGSVASAWAGMFSRIRIGFNLNTGEHPASPRAELAPTSSSSRLSSSRLATTGYLSASPPRIRTSCLLTGASGPSLVLLELSCGGYRGLSPRSLHGGHKSLLISTAS